MRRSLRRQAKETEKRILKEGEDFYRAAVQDHFSARPAKKKRFALWAPLGAVAAALALTLAIALPFMGQTEKQYFLENEISYSATVQEINALFSEYRFSTQPGYVYDVSRVADKPSGDTLFYVVNALSDDELSNVYIYFYINPAYNRFNKLQAPPTDDIINSVPVQYYLRTEVINGELYKTDYAAEIREGNSFIFVRHEQFALDKPQSDFFEFFARSFSKKSDEKKSPAPNGDRGSFCSKQPSEKERFGQRRIDCRTHCAQQSSHRLPCRPWERCGCGCRL